MLDWHKMRQWDIVLGVTGSVATWNMAEVNSLLACVAGMMTCTLLGFRVRREYLRRNAGFRRDSKGRILTDFQKELDEDSKI